MNEEYQPTFGECFHLLGPMSFAGVVMFWAGSWFGSYIGETYIRLCSVIA